MTSATEDIFSRFYTNVEAYKIAGLEQQVAEELLNGYLKKVISKPYIRKLFRSIVFDSDIGELEYTMREVWDVDADLDFVEEVLAMGMVCQWTAQQYYSAKNTMQMYSNKEQTFYSQANHMAELHSMYEKAQIDMRKYIRDRGYGRRLVVS